MKRIFVLAIVILSMQLDASAQGFRIMPGDQFPDISIRNIINGPVNTMSLKRQADKKIYILNFWGTWCSPCLPEMDSLKQLQQTFAEKVQIIAISNEEPVRLKSYLKTKPTKVWLASDTNLLLYNAFALAYVGQSAIIDAERKVLAIVRTDSINRKMLNALIRGEKISSSAEFKGKMVDANQDPFGVDSAMIRNFTVRGMMPGYGSMGKRYASNSPFAGRRLSIINITLTGIYKEVFNITSMGQVTFEVDRKLVDNYDDKSSWYSLDILVAPQEKDSLYTILQRNLNAVLPYKARIEYLTRPVYVLANKNFKLEKSLDTVSTYGYDGTGFNGKAVTLSEFAKDYLSNELDLPVVDETGIAGQYDIRTQVEMRSISGTLKSIEVLGLAVSKQERKIPVLVIY